MTSVPAGPYDWAFLVGGWVLGAIALGLLLWAMFRDRARGRLRCPKCWYDVASLALTADTPSLGANTPLVTCPECGFAVKRRKQLKRTRRRWRWIVTAMVVGLGAWVLNRTPAIKTFGWPVLIPTSALIYLAPADDWTCGMVAMPGLSLLTASRSVMTAAAPPAGPRTLEQQLGDEAWRRLRAHDMWVWQSTAFLNRHFAAVNEDPRRWLRAPQNWPVGHDVPVIVKIPENSMSLYPIRVVGRLLYYSLGAYATPAPRKAGNEVPVELEFGDGGGTVWRGRLSVPCGVRATAAECIQPMRGSDADAAVMAALAPRLVREGSVFTVMCDDRSDSPRWRAVDYVLGYRIELVLDGEVLATGRTYATWQRPVFKDWDEIAMTWSPGGNEKLRVGLQRTQFRVGGDVDMAIRSWAEWPFSDPKPEAWMGSFTCPTEVRSRPQ